MTVEWQILFKLTISTLGVTFQILSAFSLQVLIMKYAHHIRNQVIWHEFTLKLILLPNLFQVRSVLTYQADHTKLFENDRMVINGIK